MDYAKEALRLHAEWKGKLDVNPKMEINTKDDLSLAYTPGVAEPCLKIADQQCTGISWYLPRSTGCAGERY